VGYDKRAERKRLKSEKLELDSKRKELANLEAEEPKKEEKPKPKPRAKKQPE
jgi:hypothetical protein